MDESFFSSPKLYQAVDSTGSVAQPSDGGCGSRYGPMLAVQALSGFSAGFDCYLSIMLFIYNRTGKQELLH